MKFLDLEIELFLAITKATINMADRGLVLIQGVNQSDTSAQSNGAGKSTIGDALSWVLYGLTARGATGDDVINDKAGKGTRVQVRVTDGTLTWRIVRHRKHKTGKNSLQLFQHDGLKEVDLTKGTEKLTQAEVLKVIGCSHEVFVGAIYAGQEAMPDLPAMTDKHLKMLIEEAAGVTVLEEAYRIARLDRDAVAQKLFAADKKFSDINTKLEWERHQRVQTTSSITVWEANRTASIQRQTEEIQALLRDIKAIDISYDKAKAEARVAEIDAQIAGTAAENAEFIRLDRLVTEARSKVKAADTAVLVNSGAFTKAELELKNVNHKVGCPCDECGRPLTLAELAAATAAAQKKIEAYGKALDEAGQQHQAALEELERAKAALDAFMLTMTDLTAVSDERARLLREILAHDGEVNRRDLKIARAKQIKEQIEKEKAAGNPHEAQLLAHDKKIEELTNQLAEAGKAVDELTAELALEDANVALYGPAGVRATILDEVTPFLNDRTAKYLSTLSDGNISAVWSTLTANAKGELKEKFTIDVTNDKGGKKFALTSGGEKKKVRVATALALQDLVATRATKPIELFIGDEIDGALDPAGLERLTMVLEEKAAERGSVFVISHLELRDWIPNVLQIEKSPTGETTVTELTA